MPKNEKIKNLIIRTLKLTVLQPRSKFWVPNIIWSQVISIHFRDFLEITFEIEIWPSYRKWPSSSSSQHIGPLQEGSVSVQAANLFDILHSVQRRQGSQLPLWDRLPLDLAPLRSSKVTAPIVVRNRTWRKWFSPSFPGFPWPQWRNSLDRYKNRRDQNNLRVKKIFSPYMVEENFIFWWSEMLQNKGFQLFFKE